ncbi:VOC family protein [Actinokineospora xionganensis]|uniref:VOC domain-containing protein n=1 Tax=Actinokineospora xionganensis TaxID=2684470 RepID=A0ABR7L8G6_9PSEU|nr:VOC family protein [Actinokineospora xionganensis]MBC6448980.1 hypothetical protein [Actinokineospora xionganensis]
MRHESAESFRFDIVQVDHESTPEPYRDRPVAGTIFALVVEDAAAEEVRLRAAGAEIVKPGTDEPWGQRHFHVAVPGGLLLELVQMIAPDAAWLAANGL